MTVCPGARALRLGPDEWLVVAEDADPGALTARLEATAGDDLVTAVDVSAERVAVELDGPYAAALLGHMCALDLRDGAFPPGACTRTLVARLEVILERTAPATYVVRVRRSVARHLAAWLLDAVPEYAGR